MIDLLLAGFAFMCFYVTWEEILPEPKPVPVKISKSDFDQWEMDL